MRTDYTIPALAIPLLIAVACNLPACYSSKVQEPQQGNTIKFTRLTQDERGLISCTFVIGRDTAGLDYLTVQGFNNLLKGDIENVYPLHSCPYKLCPMKDSLVFTSECEEGTDCYYMDLTHWNNPTWTAEECEAYIFDIPNSNCNQ